MAFNPVQYIKERDADIDGKNPVADVTKFYKGINQPIADGVNQVHPGSGIKEGYDGAGNQIIGATENPAGALQDAISNIPGTGGGKGSEVGSVPQVAIPLLPPGTAPPTVDPATAGYGVPEAPGVPEIPVPGQVTTTNVANVAGPGAASVALPTSPTNAATVNLPGSGPATTVINTPVGPQAAQIDFDKNAVYGAQGVAAQNALMQQLSQQSQGQGPSVAGNMLKQGQENNLNAVMAQLASARGGPNALLQRQALNTSSDIQAQTARDAATARLQEQLQAQGLLANVSNAAVTQGLTQRSQDTGMATSQAGLNQSAELAKYEGELKSAIANGQMSHEGAMAEYKAQVEKSLTEAGYRQRLTEAEYQAQVQKAMTDAGFKQEAAVVEYKTLANNAVQDAMAGNTAALAEYKASNDAQIIQAQMTLQSNTADHAAKLQASQDLFQAQEKSKALTAEFASRFQELQAKYVGMGMAAEQSNQAAAVDMNKLLMASGMQDDASRKQMLGTILATAGTVAASIWGGPAAGAAAGAVTNRMLAEENGKQQTPGPVKPAFHTVTPAPLPPNTNYSDEQNITYSDQRLKTNISGGERDLEGFLDSIAANKYNYKDKKHGSSTYISPMAQELEKTPLGKGMVREDGDGNKMVDYARAAGTILSAQAMIMRRVRELEGKKK